uniref:outer dense fiber protein 2-like isoform X2 n=1 Tax=Gasterosteus aculeatus aculeatus TaxID=481459 RepID=UPI001A98A6E0|nr:outer dense fiber protein 2-like isoform X2 [Gasterosteus aculeatus aculeatus]
MKTRDSPPPRPVHVHVPETTPVHVHMRSPSGSRQHRTKGGQARGDEGRPKARAPWIPPGRPSCRGAAGSFQPQRSSAERRSGGGGQRDDEEEEEEELAAVTKNLSFLLREQESMRHLKKPDSGARPRGTDVLLRALVEAEIDGVAVANQLTALKEAMDGLPGNERPSKADPPSLRRQRELLMEKMEMFDHTNRSLRGLLRERSGSERESLARAERKDALRQRLSDCEAENIRLSAQLTNKEREASQLAVHLDFEKHNVQTTGEFSRLLQTTRCHLESELNRREAETLRLAAQIQAMQRRHEQQQEELHTLQEELHTLRQRREEEEEGPREEGRGRGDREALTLLTQRAESAEESVGQLAAKLQEKESQLAQALCASSDWCRRHAKEEAAKGQLDEDVSALKLQLTELNSELHSAEERSRAEREELSSSLHRLSAEHASTKMDNRRLRAQLTASEEKLRDLRSEARLLKSSIRKLENLVEKYKKKVQQVRLESEENRLQLEATQEEAREAQASREVEAERVKRELLGRLGELEALPDRLRRAEQQLRGAEREADAHRRRSEEHDSALAEVTRKVEQQGAQLETLQQRNLLLQEENNVLKEKIHNSERRLEDMRLENQEMSRALPSKEAAVRSVRQQLEEKTRECSAVSRQLQQAVEDAQRQVDDGVQRVLAKERASQSKALELQSQLSRARTEQSHLQRSKAEMERRFQSQLQNMKDRLEQSDSTNRSLQNYVTFLKTSYGNVFGDSLTAS